MYEQSLPPAPDSPAVAAMWARGIALAERPEMVEQAEVLARDLVSHAVRRTPAGGRIHARIEIREFGMLIEVSDPASPDPFGGVELSEVSSITLSFGSSGGPSGHTQWAELRVPLPRTASA